ncbi:MAG: hypothetical protein ABF624_09220 [Liquorilactobacillus ghanensis]|uniref:hypothetical protein n=1 Tax=Liquorilactobacillus TaxID=2767888 RepID=UPI0039E7A59E
MPKTTKETIRNLPINRFLAIYTFVLAVLVPAIVLPSFIIGGNKFDVAILSMIPIGIFGVLLSIIALRSSRQHHLQITGHVLALIGTIMVSTCALMILFFIVTPILLWASWMLLRPNKDDSTGQGYASEKKKLQQLSNSNLEQIKLPLQFYFNTDFILKLIPIVSLVTIITYGIIILNNHGKMLPGSIAPMLFSMIVILVLFSVIDLVIWLIWKQLAQPIITLDESGITYRRHHRLTSVSWNDISDLALVSVPNGQYEMICLFVFAKNPEKYLGNQQNISFKRAKLKRAWQGIQPEYFQNEFEGVVQIIPLNRLGIDPQALLLLVTTINKKMQAADKEHTPN